jgi:hypothetical protein
MPKACLPWTLALITMRVFLEKVSSITVILFVPLTNETPLTVLDQGDKFSDHRILRVGGLS